jgi:uncharacterized RDD family membrane protein YckC
MENNTREDGVIASVSNRFLAYIIDFCVGFGFVFLYFFIFTIINISLKANNVAVNESLMSFFQIGLPLLLVGYCGGFQPIVALLGDLSKKHRSVGKSSQHIIIRNLDGTDVTGGQAFLRFIIKLIPFSPIISLVMMLASEKKQTLSDKILNQIAVNKN